MCGLLHKLSAFTGYQGIRPLLRVDAAGCITYTVDSLLRVELGTESSRHVCVLYNPQVCLCVQWNLTYPVVEVPGASVYRAGVISKPAILLLRTLTSRFPCT